jgi:putative membrane-bound dehydrogenase-like protein
MLRDLMWSLCCTLLLASVACAADANRLTYLDEFCDPYYPHLQFPKLTTPQWVGEPGVECVVVLAIDDMRDPAKYEEFLRPILDRLKQIDGRAPVSIMTNQVDPADERLQGFLREGLSLEIHTFDHPCPCLAGGDFDKAKGTYDRCVDLLNQVPNNRPVAFRMPCCDSMNSPSPRFWVEAFNKTTPAGNFLTIDSSVFNIITSQDDSLPKEITQNDQGEERFRRYVPFPSFVNTIENYPYPYVIAGKCWQFPCVVPSDWSAQHVQQPNNPDTVRDFKLALDACVIKQGVYNLVFHPHGWIRNDQIVELIDHAVAKHGKKVKFLTFKECDERLRKNLLHGEGLRDAQGNDNGVRLLDANGDGYMDVVIGNEKVQRTRVWDAREKTWREGSFPDQFDSRGPRFGVLHPDGKASMIDTHGRVWNLSGADWARDERFSKGMRFEYPKSIIGPGMRFRDLDGDGICEFIYSGGDIGQQGYVRRWNEESGAWESAPFSLPEFVSASDADMRFVDLDGDKRDDIVVASEKRQGVWRFESMKTGWKKVELPENFTIPFIARGDTNNGAWFHSQHLWVQNEDTSRLADHVDRRSFAQLLGKQAADENVQPTQTQTPTEAARPVVITPTDRQSAAGQEATDERIRELGTAKSPQEALKSIVVKDGFTVELVAAEPLVVDPVAFDWGPDGRLWVVEMRDYPRGIDEHGKPGGRVKVLTDRDGDGRFDDAQVFLDHLPFPTGIKVWRKGVLITAAPEIIYAEDTTGDGVADVKTPLYRGFGEGNQQHRVNGLRWGLDNWLYVGNGDSGGTIQSLQTQERVRFSGRDIRIRPDAGELDPVSGQTQFSLCFDDAGNRFGGNNSEPVWHYVLEDFHLRRVESLIPPPVRKIVPQVSGNAPVFPASKTPTRFNDYHTANRFTSACGIEIYRDTYLGDGLYGNSLVCEPVHNLVHREVLTPQGLSFTSVRPPSEQASEFLASTDPWFRPVMARTGPDGALYIADMYRQVIEHPTWIPTDWQRRLDLRAGSDRGRIYRVVRSAAPPRKVPSLVDLSTPKLVAELDSPSGTRRDLVQQVLLWRNDQGALPGLVQLAHDAKLPQVRWQALCTLDGLHALTPDVIATALQDPHAGVRLHAVRLAEMLLPDHPALGEKLAPLEKDDDLRVQWQLAMTLHAWDDPRGGEILARLAAQHARDPYFATAVMGSLTGPRQAGFLIACLHDAQLRDAWFENTLIQVMENRDFETVRRVLAEFGRQADQELALKFRGLAIILERVAAQSEPPEQFMDDATVEIIQKIFQRAEDSLANAQKAIEERVAAATLLGRQAAAQRMTRRDTNYASLERVAADPEAPAALRVAALRGLATAPDARLPQLGAILTPQTPSPVQQAFIEGLTNGRNLERVAELLNDWRSRTPAQRTQILDALLKTPQGCKALLAAVTQQQISPRQLDAARRTRLLDHPDEKIRTLAKRALADDGPSDRAQVLAQFAAILDQPGDKARGKLVFAKRCAQCHQYNLVGQVVGPDLASLTDKSPSALLTAMLDPNRAVEDKFQSYVAIGTDGQVVTGLITNETGASITLVEPEGKTHDILRKDLETLSASGKSLMPEGLERDMPPQEFADVIAYLRAPPPKTFEGNAPAIAQPNADGALTLAATNAGIFGPSLIYEAKYQNLGFWLSEQDQAVWTLAVPRAGKYRVVFDYACEAPFAGDEFLFTIDGHQLRGKVASTGTWDDYRSVEVGQLELGAGAQEAVLQSAGPLRSALIDLKAIRLEPLP